MLTEEQLQDIFEVADLLSDGNREIFLQLRDVVFSNDPNQILESMEHILTPKAFDNFLDRVGESEKENLWLILMLLLERFDYVFMRDADSELSSFIHSFDSLQQVRHAGILLSLDSEGLDVSASMSEWATVLNDKYVHEGYCFGAIELTSECYYLFFTQQKNFNRIQELADLLGYRVDYAKFI
ncbi:hypothetical protein MKL26_01655 [Streptococcus suis]|nr:hypothetical protein [Streptococcus suis]